MNAIFELDKKNSEDDVEIISSDDDKIKLVGEIFSNDSSRKILKLLSNDNEMTANEIAQESGMSLALTIHHLKRMQTAKMIKVSKTGISAKGQEMKYYAATNQSFLITPEKSTHLVIDSLKKFSKFAAIGMAGLVSWITLKPDGGRYSPQHESGQDSLVVDANSNADESSTLSSSEMKPEVSLEDEAMKAPRPDAEPIPEPSHSGVEHFDFSEASPAHTGSVSLDRTVYPQPFDGTGAESIEPFIISIIVPIAVIAGGIILERILTRWYKKRQGTKAKEKMQ
ncbi:MAG: winged helix-turn-helix domain-containing protein [Nitrosopumilus sp.]|uniref:ArsR/SmtB family transcription factor n=1 Tax=Nitrosopumilus sp. TaxID=2024843 RepID=UPI00242A9C38|nr:winged helix-turn-helix domain-containing protein [Nitrosopumilus sp.]MCV0366374.1 winged helix-turn-helix domain-containing protein [Nitrosopumilus sp.]